MKNFNALIVVIGLLFVCFSLGDYFKDSDIGCICWGIGIMALAIYDDKIERRLH
jgi:hypothetical protein